MTIRFEQPGDEQQIQQLIVDAFASDDEARLVNALLLLRTTYFQELDWRRSERRAHKRNLGAAERIIRTAV